ncbi:class I SAM-dependent methyltransferase [Paenibacillus sp. P96]|uniref:Class I SAM-dependent methyltransferase n=1 Tax=Paenibacillus zeirhizosphaerae TaxID=2987519 RepID=A0ABT9FX99_9BACL|nr:class I SAM-dependent methyltransferase [Paenibacillus sp. P96]MDP4099352.1 class I SAM-dependent methyltransferase [Paenibacillus sp. P96]
MGKLVDYFSDNNGRLIHKWMHYFDIYEFHFDRFVGKEINLLEIGVYQGGSIQMWKHYFGEQAMIYGIDVEPRSKLFEEERVRIEIGDQGDRNFWNQIKHSLPTFDIIIDDGGHTMEQQRVTFEELYPLLSPNGVYLAEDLHTSYWSEYGGGYRSPNSFIEYSKSLIDKLNAWHSRTPELAVDRFTETTWSLTYYDSILVIEKRPQDKPIDRKTGSYSW